MANASGSAKRRGEIAVLNRAVSTADAANVTFYSISPVVCPTTGCVADGCKHRADSAWMASPRSVETTSSSTASSHESPGPPKGDSQTL